MFDSTTLKTYRTAAVFALAAAFLAGCGQVASVQATGTQAAKSAITAKKPGHDTVLVKDQVRAYLESSKPGYMVTVRELDVVPGPTIAIYPPVKPSVYDFTAKLEVVQLDDRLQQYVVTGSYNLNTKRVTVSGHKPTVF